MRRPDLAALAAVLALAALLRFWSLDHGLPRNYLPDTSVVRAALSLGAGANPWAGDALPTQYPYLLPYLLFAVYSGFYLVGRVGGAFAGLGDFRDYAFDHPETFFLLARVVVALVGCLVVLLVARIGLRLTTRRAALFAALFAATSLVHVQLSQQERPHIVTTAGILASLLAALRYRDRGASGDLAASFFFAAAAGSTAPYGFLALIVPLAVARHRPAGASRGLRLASGLAIAAATTVACFPRLVLGTGEAFGYERSTGVVRYFGGLLVAPRLVNGRGFAKLAAWSASYEPLLLLLAAISLWALVRSREERRRWLPVAAYPALFVLVYGAYEVIHPRYLVSLVPFLALAAGRALDLAVTRVAGARDRPQASPRPSRSIRAAGAALVGTIAFLPGLVQAARLDLLLGREDTRSQAEAWILAHLPAGETVGLEAGGVELQPDRDSLERLAALAPRALGVRDRERLARGDDDGRSLVRLWEIPDYRDSTAAEIAAPHGLSHVVAVVAGERPRIDRFYLDLVERATLVGRWSPLASSLPAETRLPAELTRPLVDLWRVERPGPIVELFSLRKSDR